MKLRSALVLGLAAAIGAGLLLPAEAAKKSKPVVVATDPDDDWGANADPNIAAAGDALGMELVEASIGMADAKTVDFVIKLKSLPPSGGIPEFVRYLWVVTVDGELLQIDGKFTNYSRGTCDPTAGTCPPPRDPGSAPFLVRGDCVNNTAAVTCTEIGLVHGTFDAAAATITVPVSLEMLRAKAGSVIAHGSQPDSGFSGVLVIPSVWASQSSMPLDTMTLTKTFRVPK